MKMRKMLSFLLALVMAVSLAVPAFADESDPPEKELRFAWLMHDEGFYAEDIVLNGKDNPFEGGMGMSPVGERFAIFFIWNNKTNQREKFVVPEGDGNITVTKLAGDEIAKEAKQSTYYVKLHMNEFKDGEVTSNGLSFHIDAMLDDFGFYSAEKASADTVLGDEVEAAKLTDNTLYFCATYMGTDEAKDHDAVTKAEKDHGEGDDNSKCYDIEQVKDGLWKLTINEVGQTALKQWGGVHINLKLEVKQPDGQTRQDGRHIFVKGEENNQGPELFLADIEGQWDDEAQQDFFFVNKDLGGQGNGKQLHAGNEHFGIFGTIKEGERAYTDHGFNWDAFTPVDVKSLKTPDGLTVESISDQAKKGEKWGKYFVKVTVAENGKEYKVTSGDYSIAINSNLPEISVYSADTASFDTWMGTWGYGFHPANADKTYYLISIAADNDGMNSRHLTGVKFSKDNLSEDCGNSLMNLEKVSDNVYKLNFKKDAKLKTEFFRLELDLTWVDFMGNTWTDTNWQFGFDPVGAIVASETKLTDKYDEMLPYSEADGKVSTSVSMKTGEKKEVYLYATPIRQDGMYYRAFGEEYAINYYSNDDALTLSFDKDEPSKFTLSASEPGTYEIFRGNKDWDYDNMKFTHADGKPYTKAETEAWHNDPSFYIEVDNDGKMLVWGSDQPYEEAVPFEEYFKGDTYELGVRSEKPLDQGWQRLTVTVASGAKVADLFDDVKAGDWFEKAVQYVYDKGLMKGTDKGFEPTREVYNTEMIQILWNLAGKPEAEATVSAAEGQWYAGAVNWAASVKLIDGSAFDGQKLITRGEVREMMDAYGKLVEKDYSNLFRGNESGDMMLDKALSRAELAQVLLNAQA